MRRTAEQGFSYFHLLLLVGLFSMLCSMLARQLNNAIINDAHNSQLQIAVINLANSSLGNDETSKTLNNNPLPNQLIKNIGDQVMVIWKTDNQVWLCPNKKIKSFACITI